MNHLFELRLGRSLTLFELVEHFPAAFDTLAGGLEERVQSATVVVVFFEDVARDEFVAFGAADKDGLGATGVTNDDIFQLLRVAAEAGLVADFHERDRESNPRQEFPTTKIRGLER